MEKAPGCAPAVPVERLEVRAYQFPTGGPGGLESDGTFTWRDTTCVVVQAEGGGQTGARAVQIDIDGRYAGMRYPDEVNLVGDAAATLRALLPRLRRRATAPGANRWKRTWPAGGRL